MSEPLVYACVGFKDFDLKPNEELKIINGITLHAIPERVWFVKEYTHHIVVAMEFVKSLFDPNMAPRVITTSISKKQLLTGDVLLKRMSDGIYLNGNEVGKFEYR